MAFLACILYRLEKEQHQEINHIRGRENILKFEDIYSHARRIVSNKFKVESYFEPSIYPPLVEQAVSGGDHPRYDWKKGEEQEEEQQEIIRKKQERKLSSKRPDMPLSNPPRDTFKPDSLCKKKPQSFSKTVSCSHFLVSLLIFFNFLLIFPLSMKVTKGTA